MSNLVSWFNSLFFHYNSKQMISTGLGTKWWRKRINWTNVPIHDFVKKLKKRSQEDINLFVSAKVFNIAPYYRLSHKLEYYGIELKTSKFILFLPQKEAPVRYILSEVVSSEVPVLSDTSQLHSTWTLIVSGLHKWDARNIDIRFIWDNIICRR